MVRTIQDGVSTATVVIPVLGDSALCAVCVIKAMLRMRHLQPDQPLLQAHSAAGWNVLTDSTARKHSKQVSYITGGGSHLGVSEMCACSPNPGPGHLDFLCLEIHCFPFSLVTFHIYWLFYDYCYYNLQFYI